MEETSLRNSIIDCLKSIYDPEIPVSIYDLGLIYEIKINDKNEVQIIMTLTTPACPAAQSIPVEVDQKVRLINGVKDVSVTITWDPPWDKSMMSEAAQLDLGMF